VHYGPKQNRGGSHSDPPIARSEAGRRLPFTGAWGIRALRYRTRGKLLGRDLGRSLCALAQRRPFAHPSFAISNALRPPRLYSSHGHGDGPLVFGMGTGGSDASLATGAILSLFAIRFSLFANPELGSFGRNVRR
jgi:hypothetical protein